MILVVPGAGAECQGRAGAQVPRCRGTVRAGERQGLALWRTPRWQPIIFFD